MKPKTKRIISNALWFMAVICAFFAAFHFVSEMFRTDTTNERLTAAITLLIACCPLFPAFWFGKMFAEDADETN